MFDKFFQVVEDMSLYSESGVDSDNCDESKHFEEENYEESAVTGKNVMIYRKPMMVSLSTVCKTL